jgi:very-short-patch-repair endonuclease
MRTHQAPQAGCMNTTRAERLERWSIVSAAAQEQDGILHRRQLYALGVTRSQIKAELKARRWRAWGRQSIAVHTGALGPEAEHWRAVFETGADAALDGVSALLAAGLEHFESRVIHVSVSKGATYRRTSGVRIHETRRRRPEDVRVSNPRRVRAATAAIRAALWAASRRQAALLLILVVQQGLATPAQLNEAFTLIRRDRRRRFIAGVLADIADGVQSMGELDFARLCRQRGLPPPDRQVRRRLANGRVYLDAYWDQFGVVVEIEGMQHLLPGVAVDDSLRQNRLTIDNDKVLRIPVLGLRVAADQFMDQLECLLRDNGFAVSTSAA